jgi:cytidyltransferase-like protein
MKVLVNGVFDLLHSGHKVFLWQASALGDLVVGLNTDDSVRELKGDSRPIQPFAIRADAIQDLLPDALILPLRNSDEFVLMMQPDIIVRGWDQTVSEVDSQFRVLRLPRAGEISTTKLVERKFHSTPVK